MKKTMFLSFIVVLTAVCLSCSDDEDGSSLTRSSLRFSEGDLRYTATDTSSVSVSGTTGKSIRQIEIPSSVTYKGKNYAVTSIGDSAFCNCLELSSITLPSSVTSIGDSAFYHCSTLDSIKIPSTVTSLGNCAFAYAGITTITIPKHITSIGDSAFYDCTKLKEICIRNSTPPSVGIDGLYQVDKSTCKIYVPVGSGENYGAADAWKEFLNKEETSMAPDKLEYVYQPFIMDGTCVWQSSKCAYGSDIPEDSCCLISNEDSVYQGKTYKKIYDYPLLSTDKKDKVCVGLLREDKKRVYCVGSYSMTQNLPESLLYDFNLTAGDEFTYYSMKLKVSYIDTIQLEGVWRRKFYFMQAEYPHDAITRDYWLEGIGCLGFQGITDPFGSPPKCCYYLFYSVVHGDKALYKRYSDGRSRCIGDPVQTSKAESKISYYVKDQTLYITTGEQEFAKLDIYSSDAKLITSVVLNEKSTQIEQSLSGIPPGSYLFIVASADSQQSGDFIVQ